MYQETNGSARKLNRTSSQICPTPEEELLDAVRSNNTPKIEQLIRRNEHLLSYTYPDEDKRILLLACSEDGVTSKTVETLLNLRANPRDHTDDGWEALHFASQKTDFDLLNILLTRNPGDINAVDNYGNNVLQILIRHGKIESSSFVKCAELLIKSGINIDHADNKNKTAAHWAEKKGVGDIIRGIIEDMSTTNSPPQFINNNQQNDKSDGGLLMNFLKQQNQEGFINFRNRNIGDLVNYREESSLLQFCCEKGLADAARYLLENGADPNETGRKNDIKPIVIAANHGYGDIFENVLNKYDQISKIPEGLLANILQYIDSEHHDNERCYKAFMDKMKSASADEVSLKLNETNNMNNTPLHYAIRYGDAEIITELLSFGASLGAKNKYGVMPIQDIEPETLNQHLDNCVMFDHKSKNFEKEDFTVTFNYRSLIPPYAKSSQPEGYAYKDPEISGINSTIQKELVAETEVIFFMSKTSEFKHLLKHPVIVSFLFMKWLRVQWLFWVNLAFYVIFALSLVVYIFSGYAYFSTKEKSAIHNFFVNLSYVSLFITLVLLMLRELFQICVAPRKYFKNFENYIEIILIVITSMIVFIKSPTEDTRKQLSSLSILLAAFELVLMLGQHPYFSTNVVMLRTVSFNFFKFLIWYSLLIIAFALSFYLLFTKNDLTSEDNTSLKVKNETSEDDDDKSFGNPGRSFFKTIVMLTGEFDASDINFDTFPVTSKLIFALFVFMIAIILLNLLNGLAVSDTQMIKNDAELVGHIARAQHIRYVESMLVGNILPINCIDKLSGICCCLPILKNWKFGIGKAFARDACLFPKYLNYELVFKPNKNGRIDFIPNEQKRLRKSCAPCADLYLDRETIRRTNNIVRAHRDEVTKSGDDIKTELEILRKKMDAILILLKPVNNSIE